MRAARKIFLKNGTKAPVATIAKELKVTPAALFHRYKSKELLFIHALWPADPPELEMLETGPAEQRDARDQLIDILHGLTKYLAHAVPAIFLLHTAGVRVGRKLDKTPPMLRLHIELTKWLQRAAARGKIRIKIAGIATEALLGALETRYLRGYVLGEKFTSAQNRVFIRKLVDEVIR